MNDRFILIALLSAAAVSCTVTEVDRPEGSGRGTVFYATIEDQPDGLPTRTYTDESLRIFWDADDHITVFDDVPVGADYAFLGEDGDTGGNFEMVSGGVGGEEDLGGWIYSVYPHRNGTTMSGEGVISFTLPAVQTYRGTKSFGKGADVMVAKTIVGDNRLRFKNVGGFLSFKLYGGGVSVSSVILKGRNGERLAGACSIDMSGDNPVVTMADDAKDEVRIYCEEPVSLASTSEGFTEFMFVLPPVTFGSEGFTLIVTTPDGGVFTKEMPVALEIERNRIKRFAPLEVLPEQSSEELRINSLSSDRGGRTYRAVMDEANCADTLTIPTVTDFSALVLDYDIDEGDVLLADGREIVSGVTAVDASKPVTLTVCRGYLEKRYSLVARNMGLPVVRITTTGFTQQDLDDDEDHDTWRPAEGESASASVRIEYPDGTIAILDKNGKEVKNAKTQIKGRGNATWTYAKRPYTFKLDKKGQVLGMPLSKRWILLANWKDRTLLRNDAAFWLSKQSGLPYTVDGRFVELEFNGVHRGNYYLCEQIKIEENRVEITEMEPGYTDKTGGFLLEIDNNWDELRKFQSSKYGLRYQFKSPDVDNDSDTTFNAAFSYMQSFVNALESKIKNARTSDYKDYFDIDSAIWFMLVNELTGNGDFYNENWSATYKGPHSTYLYKDHDTVNPDGSVTVSKLHMGPVWDFDYLTFMPGRSSKWAGASHSGYYYYNLFQDSQFRSRLSELWEGYKEAVYQGLPDYIDGMADVIRLSETFNTEMWGYNGYQQDQNEDNGLSFQEAVDRMKQAYQAKWTWMDNKFKNLNNGSWSF